MMRVIPFEIGVRVPFSVAVNLDETDAALDQPPGHQTFCPDVLRDVVVQTVKAKCLFRFGRKISQIAGLHLHSISQLEALNTREQVRFTLVLFEVGAVDLFQEIELGSLIFASDMLRPGEIENRRALPNEKVCPDRWSGEKPALQLSGPPFTPWLLPSTT
jgi:hypothetical protein